MSGCQIFNPGISSKPINMYPPKDIKIKFQQDWQYELYHKRIADFKKFPIGFKKIVFLGNSITEGAKSWNKRLNQKNLVNRGVSGDITEGVLERLGEIYYYKPLGVFLLIGINDLFDQNIIDGELISPEYVADNIFSIAKNIIKESKHTIVYVQTILPVNLDKYQTVKGFKPEHKINLNTQIKETNFILKNLELPEKIEMLDIHEDFLDSNNQLSEIYTDDGVHLNESGYDVWVKILDQKVKDINTQYLR